MHLGNAFAYLMAWLSARSEGGEVVLRMEDLDTLRCTEEYAGGIRQDLRWLGLEWDRESPPQRLRSKEPEKLQDAEYMRTLRHRFNCWYENAGLRK